MFKKKDLNKYKMLINKKKMVDRFLCKKKYIYIYKTLK